MARPKCLTVKAGQPGDRRVVIAVHAQEPKRPPANGTIRVLVQYGECPGFRPERPAVGSVVQLVDPGDGLIAWIPASVKVRTGPKRVYHCPACEAIGHETAQKKDTAPICSCGRRKTRRRTTAVTVQLSPADTARIDRAASATGEKRATLAGRVLSEWLAERKP